jgi:hypothetical protein
MRRLLALIALLAHIYLANHPQILNEDGCLFRLLETTRSLLGGKVRLPKRAVKIADMGSQQRVSKVGHFSVTEVTDMSKSPAS